MHRLYAIGLAVLFVAAPCARAGLTPDQIKALPKPADHAVDFKTEIKPIFEASCIRCHGRGRDRGGFQIDSRERLIKGGESGPGATPGNGAGSYLVEVISGLNADEVMPKKGKRLTPEEVAVVRAWVDQGMKWDLEISFAPVAPQNLDPRSPAEPAGHGEANPLDRFLDVYFEKHHMKSPDAVSDRSFARRAYLDTIGLTPPATELDAFVSSDKPDKRAALVADLLSRENAFAQNWLSFWNDLLRNDYRGTGYIDGGREQITDWLYSALRTNMPYDKFVAQLIDPNKGSEGFTKGIVWRGTVNASEMPQMQAAQNVSQVFMGVNLKCASCHDSFINDWQLSDAYGLANVFSESPLEIYRCDQPTGQKAATKFIFSQLGDLPATTNKQERLRALAGVVTCPKDGRLSRTIVNRLWAKFLGRGLVEPVDDMQQTAWDSDLLDWLAEDLVAHHYDLKWTMARILTSRAYQLPAVDLGEHQSTNFVFTGPSVRRMTAEQFRDALDTLAEARYPVADAMVDYGDAARKQFKMQEAPLWIWNTPKAAEDAPVTNIYLRKTVKLTEQPREALAVVFCDNSFELFVNGHKAGSGNDYSRAYLIDMRKSLKKGENVIAVRAANAEAKAPNPAGFLAYMRIRIPTDGEEEMADFASDKTWIVTDVETKGWEKPGFAATNWTAASELGSLSIAPWGITDDKLINPFLTRMEGGVRSALVAADPLAIAMGRPNREQVVTTRASLATTLQALELTNGKTLESELHKASANLLKKNSSGPTLVADVYENAIGRKPTKDELTLATTVVGQTPTREGVEDFLWGVAMLPEFQLIY